MIHRQLAECFPIEAFLLEELEERGWTMAQFAARIHVPLEELGLIARGDARLPLWMAEAFQHHLGPSAVYWSNLDMAWRMWKAGHS